MGRVTVDATRRQGGDNIAATPDPVEKLSHCVAHLPSAERVMREIYPNSGLRMPSAEAERQTTNR